MPKNYCAECALGSYTCCMHPRLVVTKEEVERLGITLCALEYHGEGAWDPIWDRTIPLEVDGVKYELVIERVNGQCPFLSPWGCTLPKEERPRICRVYPFWLAGGAVDFEKDAFDKEQGHECLLMKENLTKSEVLEYIGETEEGIERMAHDIYADAVYNKCWRQQELKKALTRKSTSQTS